MARRLMLRLTRRCNCACEHCTIADLPDVPERTSQRALEELVEGRQRGCDELVVMRGEPTLRRDLIPLVRAARRLGYHHVQLQTNGRMLCYAEYLGRLVGAGVTFLEISLFGPDAAVHDRVAGEPGAFAQTVEGVRNVVRVGLPHLLTVPIVRANLERLPATAELAAALGSANLQFNFTRPVRVDGRFRTGVLVRLAELAPLRAAMARARALGLSVSTEAVPLCHLDPRDRPGAERPEYFIDVRVSDLHRRHESFADHQRENRPRAPACSACEAAARCPVTWAAYQELYGVGELRAIRGAPDDGGAREVDGSPG